MSEHNLFYYLYASFTDRQLPLLKVAALWFDKFVILDPVGASWDTIGADHIARDAVRQLKDVGILEIVTRARGEYRTVDVRHEINRGTNTQESPRRTARRRRRTSMNKITFALRQRMKRPEVVDLQDTLQLLQQFLSPLMNCEVPR